MVIHAARNAAAVIGALDRADIETLREGALFGTSSFNAARIGAVGLDIPCVEAAIECIAVCRIQPTDDAAGGVFSCDRTSIVAIRKCLLIVLNFTADTAGIVIVCGNITIILNS